MSQRRYIDDSTPRWFGFLQSRQQQKRKKKMPQVVCLELRLKSIFRLLERTHHHASIINEYVNFRFIGLQVFGAFPNAL